MTEMEWRETFKHNLRKIFKRKGYRNQKEFALAAGISERTMSRIMSCTITASSNTVKLFARVLDCDIEDLAPLEYIKRVYIE